MASPKFTPVRRAEPRIYNKLVDEDDGSVWTATRCQRILRSLTSRISTIRKKHERYFDRERATIITATEPGTTSSFAAATQPPTLKHKSQEGDEDPDWAPGKPAKRPRHTYSTRGVAGRPRGRPVRNGVTGQVGPIKSGLTTSTPRIHISKLLNNLATPSDSPHRTISQTSPAAARKRRRTAPVSRSHDDILRGSEHIWDGIKSSLDSILIATSPLSEVPRRERRGTRSLFASCLGKIPRYILESQDAIDEEENSDFEDVTSVVYTHLESLSINPEAGWKPMRDVVRAHAVEILAEAIREFLIPFHIATEWAFLCARKDFVDGGVRILEALVETQIEHSDTCSSSEQSFESVIGALQDFGALYSRGHLLWRFIESAFLSGSKGLRWLMDHRRQNLWTRCIDPIFQGPRPETKESVYDAISMFFRCGMTGNHLDMKDLVHQLRVKSHQRRTSRRNRPLKLDSTASSANILSVSQMPYMFLSIMEALVTVTILRPMPENPALALRQNLFRHIALVKEVLPRRPMSELQDCINFMPILSLKITEAFTDVRSSELPHLEVPAIASEGTQQKTQVFDILARLVTSVAENCGAASGQEASSFSHSICRHLLAIALKSTSKDLAQIAVTAAYDFAERHPQRVNLDLALEFEEEVEGLAMYERGDEAPSSPSQLDTKESRRVEVPFRWEDSISEWVAKTPQVKKNGDSKIPVHSHERPPTQTPARRSSRNIAAKAHGDCRGQYQLCEHESRQSDRENSPDELSDSDIEDVQGYPSSKAETPTASTHGRALSSRLHGRRAVIDRPARFLGQVKVPPVSKALKRCVSEPALNVEPAVKRQKRTRLSNESGAFYTREGKKVFSRRASARLVKRTQSINPDEDSEDELGM